MENLAKDVAKNVAKDVAEFVDYKKQCRDNTLLLSHPVWLKVWYWARVVAKRRGCPDYADDLAVAILTSLANEGSNYEGQNFSSLDHYIVTALERQVLHEVRPLVSRVSKEHRNSIEYASLDEEKEDQPIMQIPDLSTLKEEQKVAVKIAIEDLLAEFPPLEHAIAEILIEHGLDLSERDLADEATKKTGAKVGRHKAKQAREHVIRIFTTALWLI